jgi:hypothetical protein
MSTADSPRRRGDAEPGARAGIRGRGVRAPLALLLLLLLGAAGARAQTRHDWLTNLCERYNPGLGLTNLYLLTDKAGRCWQGTNLAAAIAAGAVQQRPLLSTNARAAINQPAATSATLVIQWPATRTVTLKTNTLPPRPLLSPQTWPLPAWPRPNAPVSAPLRLRGEP